MRTTIATLLAATLTLHGCAPTRVSVTPRQADGWRRFADSMPVGSEIKVRTAAGDRFTGTLIAADDTGIDVNPKVRIPEPIRRVPFNEIATLERVAKRDVSIGQVAAIAGAIGVAAAAGVFLLLLAAYGD